MGRNGSKKGDRCGIDGTEKHGQTPAGSAVGHFWENPALVAGRCLHPFVRIPPRPCESPQPARMSASDRSVPANGGCKALAPLGPASIDNRTPTPGGHARAKSVSTNTLDPAGLKSPLHDCFLKFNSVCSGEGTKEANSSYFWALVSMSTDVFAGIGHRD